MTYFAVIRNGRRIEEVRVTKQPGQRSHQEPTGVVYRSMAEAITALGAKNR